MSVGAFILAGISDPNTKGLSSTRLSALSLVVSAIVFAFMHPDQPAMAAALLGGGALSFFNRAKSEAAP